MPTIVRKILFGLPLLLGVHLGGVALWSMAVVDEVLASYPAARHASALSPVQQNILLKVEDPTFFSHPGVSIANGQGVTTITSSLAREAFLFQQELDGMKGVFQSFYRGVFNCCKKVDLGRDVMALVLNAHLDKERQLALFTQHVYMGRANGQQIRGLAQASSIYLGKPLEHLSDTEFASLVGMMQAPNLFNPLSNRPAFEQRAAKAAAVASEQCVPDGWFDTSYPHCLP